MDSKDARRDVTYSADDEEDLYVRAALTKDAILSFHSGKFAECVDVLNQLLLKKEDDPQVLHNLAIAKYFQEGCSDPKKLLEVLSSIKKRSEELGCVSGEQVEAGSNSGTKGVTGSKATNLQAGSVLMLNIAVILFHLHEYAKACTILDTLYQKIEPVDESTALHICLLFLDVLLALPDLSKFIDVINYVDKAYCNVTGQTDNGNSAQEQSSNTVTKSSSLPINTTISDTSNDDSAAVTGNSSEILLSRTLSEENLESLIWTIDMNGQSTMRTLMTNDVQSDKHISTNELKLKLHLYKVRFLLLVRNLKSAKREIKTAMSMNIASEQDSSIALILKSQLESARGNYQKSIKLLMASNNRTELGMISSSIYNNNLGCIYYRLGKYHTSSIFFSRALSNNSLLRKEKPLTLSTFSQDKSLQITYNCGLQYLACGKPLLAARCFHKASLIYHNKPLLWLRIAECCLMALEKGLLNREKSEIKLHVVGQGKWRQISVEDGVSDFVRSGWVLGNDKQPELTIFLAKQCLLNALCLLDAKEQSDELIMIKQAILVDLSYVELELGNPLKALTNARSLLQIPDCSKINIFLGNVYAAESLCLLNRPKEAAEHLLAYLSKGGKFEVPYTDDDCQKWRVESNVVILEPQEACGTLYASLAYLLAVQGDLEQAERFVMKALTMIPNNPEIILTAVYVDLASGRMVEGLARLKESSHARFLPSKLEIKGSW
ncbi:CCR4-NOT transcription complex subunit 10 [Impatiens glandulifera]|uniref:CCR4-NOT transcription complex subunit 10 n=1 Tax=Impatiens glandulifera TaxID=253017 RepID=UPI001FB0B4FE|nr:CCR4-NOT transcription complex subunit 10 [Impatiens glandulifera]